MELQLKGKTAIVTGASKGIGRAIAKALAAEGANVIITARREQELQDAAEEIKKIGSRIVPVRADMGRTEHLEQLVHTAIEEFGGVDILVNNAGSIDKTGPIETIATEQWRKLFEINLFGVVTLTNLVIPLMQKKKWGRIINISSENAEQPDPMMVHYNATKAALNSFSKSLSKAYGKDNILVNTVSPAFIETPLVNDMIAGIAKKKGSSDAEAVKQFLQDNRPGIVLGRAGKAEEIGGIVAFLASGQASFITGAVIRVDGGSVGTM